MKNLWIFSALLFVLVSPWAADAATRYVDGSCSQNGNGTTTTCGANGPWNSIAQVTCAGFAPGDILEIRGGTYSVNNWNTPAACGGSSGNPVIIQNYANEAVTWEGTTDIRASTWTSQGGGVYLCTGGTCGTSGKFPFRAWYKRGSGAEEELDLIQSNRSCDSSLPAGKMRYTTGNAVCAHLSDGSSPAAAAYFRIPTSLVAMNLCYGNCADGQGLNHTTFRRNPSGGSFTIRRYRDHGIQMTNTDNTGITIDGLDIGWMMDRCINDAGSTPCPTSSVHNVRNSKVHHCGQEGIDLRCTSGASIIENNEVYQIQKPPVFEKCYQVGSGCLQGMADNGVGMMIGGTANAVIRGNVVHDYGGGTYNRSYGVALEHGAPNAVIENNYFYNAAHFVAGNSNYYGGSGIMLESTQSDASYNGAVFRNNRVFNVDQCFSLSNVPFSSGQTVKWQNNTCVDAARFGLLDDKGAWSGSSTMTFQNMIFANVSRPLAQAFFYVSNASTGIGKATTSAFWCPAPYCSASQSVIVWRGSSYTNNQASLSSYQAGNFYGDPLLSISGGIPTLKTMSTSGSAYNHGATLTGFAQDFEGNMRPQGGAWDIGADEFASGQLAAPVLLEVLPVP